MSRNHIPVEERMKVMGPMFRAGMRNVDISRKCGITPGGVAYVRDRALVMGLISHAEIPKQKDHVTYGNLYQAITPQSAGFRRWVLDNTPKGSTPAEALIAIALDVYHEEVGE